MKSKKGGAHKSATVKHTGKAEPASQGMKKLSGKSCSFGSHKSKAGAAPRK